MIKNTLNIQTHRRHIHHRLRHLRRKTTRHPTIPEFLKIPAKVVAVADLWLVTQRKPLETTVPNRWVRWLLRWVFSYYGFACRSHCDCDGSCYASIEYRGVFSDEADARWWASCPGGAYKPLPFNMGLPEETVNYKAGDVPFSEMSAEYRKGISMPYIPVPRAQRQQEMQQLVALSNQMKRAAACAAKDNI